MREAIALARTARPSPNPRVGCVLVREDTGELVGRGFHRVAGGPHAEANALEDAGEKARGATAYVTLEPCNHHGRTPPCTEALLRAGVSRVVVGMSDPNPHVAGGGSDRLRAAGVAVETGVEERACNELLRAWRHAVVYGLPYVVLKVGMSLDGRIATRTGASKWITGPAARADAHVARAQSDAVLVGIGTALADDPLLTARGLEGPSIVQPTRVVLDTHARLPVASALARSAHEAPVWLLHGHGADPSRVAALQSAGVVPIALPVAGDGRVDLYAGLAALHARGVVEVLVEGGGSVHGALLDEGLANAVRAYVAPVILGGRDAVSAFGGLGAEHPDGAPRLRAMRVDVLGDDLRITAEIEHVHRDRDRGR